MRKSRSFFPILIATIVLSAQLTASGVWADTREEFERRIDPGRDARLTVKNVNGNMTVESDDIDYVLIKAVKKTKKGQDELDKVAIEVSTGNHIVVETKVVDRGLLRNGPRVSVDFEITVPRDFEIERLESVNGNVRAHELAGDFTAKTTNGNVFIERPTDRITASTTNGGVEVEDATSVNRISTTNGSIDVSFSKPYTGDCEIKTVNGGVEVAVPFDLDAEVDLAAVNGRVDASGLSVTLISSSKKSLKATLREGGPKIRIRTTNGAIRLRKK